MLVVSMLGVVSSNADVSITITSSKGWSKSETFNNLGLTTSSVLSGPGVPAATLTPDWRADGSLEGVEFTASGDIHRATFNSNGALATLTAPGKGDILGGHSISGGQETLTVDGVTTVRKLDGTQTTTSGSDVPNKTETLATSGSGFKSTTTPTAGAATEVVLNAAGSPNATNYAAGAGEARDYYTGGLLKEITLARGGKPTFGYSPDGAKDLISVAWPAVASASFSHPKPVFGVNHGTETKSLHDGKMRFLRPKHKSPEILVVNRAVHRIPESCQTSPVRLLGVIASRIFSMSDDAVVFRILILCPERLTSTLLPVASLPALTSVSGSTNAIPLPHFF